MTGIRVHLLRAGVPESVHRVHGVVARAEDGPESVFGAPDTVTFWRSSMKPFQALPVVREGVLDALGLGAAELALACASHHARPEHLEVVQRMLDAAGLRSDDLACGPHRPIDDDAARALDRSSSLPGRMHNNCSGKHAAMLALCASSGWSLEGYHLPSHPMQAAVRAELRGWIRSDPDALPWGVDGCGVPTPALSLREMAGAYARLAASEDPAVGLVVSAMTDHPNLVSGPSAFSAQLMTATEGRLMGKEGAEGVFCVACRGESWGAAFKVADGAMRALGPAITRALGSLGLLREAELERLATLLGRPVENTRGDAVASLEAELDGTA